MQPNGSQATEAKLRNSRANLRPFVKGDPRINRKGRPKSFDEFRKLVQSIMAETIETKNGKMTAAEAMVRHWTKSKDPALHRLAVEYGFGKVPEKLETTGLENKTVLILHHAHERRDAIADTAATLALPASNDGALEGNGNNMAT